MVYAKRLQRAAGVCPECGHHSPLTAPERLVQLLDAGSVEALPVDVPDADVLAFVDSKPYPDRLRDARRRTGLDEAVLCARGRIAGHPVVVAAMDFRFLGGSLGAAVGEAITRACEVAEAERTPLLLVSASGGARMQEGILALMQMAKTSQALRRLDEAGVLTISLITDPTYGGVAASFATLCDVIVAEPGARLGFAGPRVIAQTIGETLPAGFQTAEYLLEHGIIDLIAPRAELRGTLAKLLAVGGGAAEVTDEPASVLVRDAAQLPERHPWEAVRAARRFGRPTTLDYANLLLEDFTELHGDRMAADCTAMITGLGRLAGIPVVLVGTQKGRTPAELPKRNYGMPTPAGYRKAARAMRLAGKLGLPVVSLVDTSGAFPGVAAEEQGQAVAIAENLRLLSGLPVPVVAVVTGEGGSGGALALALADEVLMCGDAVYSVITPEGCASILWKDAGAAPRAAEALRVDARSLLDLGVVDGVVPEAEHGDHVAAADNLGSALVGSLLPLSRMDRETRLARRHERFRRFGAPHIGETA
ncbi:acetyl-CoA carboxylase, carboxyltransferase subunit beta [Pseudonocardia kujensis]|nr:acetyl-CoA carboxylase, carboxyltransferase subunit beta [Pseudonocardia kujensis]